MKSSKRIRLQTTLGELVSVIWEETEALLTELADMIVTKPA